MYFRDVAKLGESLVLPPEIHPIYLEKEFIPADVEDNGIPKVITFGSDVWCGAVQCSVMWYSVVRFGVVLYSVVWCGVVLYSVVWCGAVQCSVVWCCTVWCGVVRCGIA